MLCSLTFACLGVILLPCEACFLPGVVDGLDKVETEFRVEVFGEGLVRTFELRVFLKGVSKRKAKLREGGRGTYQELNNGEIVDVHPDRSTPVVLVCAIELVFLAQAANTVITP